MLPVKGAIIVHSRTHLHHNPDDYFIIDQKTGEVRGKQPTQDKACDAARKLGYQLLTARKA